MSDNEVQAAPYCEECQSRADQLQHCEEYSNELQTEVQQLKHELRKYEPSDAMMIQLLGLNETIREAAALLTKAWDVEEQDGDAFERWRERKKAWLASPIVQRATGSPLAKAIRAEGAPIIERTDIP
jgi:hypothetical protein